jgi:hypothetical protein
MKRLDRNVKDLSDVEKEEGNPQSLGKSSNEP